MGWLVLLWIRVLSSAWFKKSISTHTLHSITPTRWDTFLTVLDESALILLNCQSHFHTITSTSFMSHESWVRIHMMHMIHMTQHVRHPMYIYIECNVTMHPHVLKCTSDVYSQFVPFTDSDTCIEIQQS